MTSALFKTNTMKEMKKRARRRDIKILRRNIGSGRKPVTWEQVVTTWEAEPQEQVAIAKPQEQYCEGTWDLKP
jgi:hypothetical protein